MAKKEETEEKFGSNREIMNIIRTNQRIVDDLVRVNSELISKISSLVSSNQELVKKISDFLESVEVVEEEKPSEEKEGEEKTEREKELEEKIAKLERRINALLLSRIPKSKWEAMRKKTTAPTI